MKNKFLKVLLAITVISSLFLCGLLYLMVNKGNSKTKKTSKLKEFQDKYDQISTDSKTIAPNIYTDFSADAQELGLYNPERHTEVENRIESLKKMKEYTPDDPLLILNPYGTNTLSLYVYFKTGSPSRTTYRISGQGGVPTFSASCKGSESCSEEHEYLFIGLNPGNNRVAMTVSDEFGNSGVRTFFVNVEKLVGQEKTNLILGKGSSNETLSKGMFVHFGGTIAGQSMILMYDNDGAIRGEIPLLSGQSRRFVTDGDRLYFNVSDTQIVGMNEFGKAERLYELNGYTIGEDYCLDETGKILYVLASKAGEPEKGCNDRVLELNLLTGESKELLDMGVLLPEYKDLCKPNIDGELDWLGLGSILAAGNDAVLLGASEASSVIKVSDIHTVPTVSYLLGEEKWYAGSGYESALYLKKEAFESFFGGNTVTYCYDGISEKDRERGVYGLILFDNHIGKSESRPDFDFFAVGKNLGTTLKKGTTSYFAHYIVNEMAGTWELVETAELPYSGYDSSVQLLENGNLVASCAGRFSYGEYDKEKQLIRTYTSNGDDVLKRVFKYDFKDFYFMGDVEEEEPTESTEKTPTKKAGQK